MEEDGATRLSFWDETGVTGGDLASFIKAFDGTTNVLLMIERRESKALCGAFWVTQIHPGHQAFVSMWMRHEHRGTVTVEAAALALSYTFDSLAVQQVWSITPWFNAGALCRHMGFEQVAVLPEFCQLAVGTGDVFLYRLTKDRWNHGKHFHKGI